MRELKRQPRRRRRYGAPCLHVLLDGKRCKQRGWLGGEFCFQHDPETAELRRPAGRTGKKRLTKGQEVEELLDETLAEVGAGRMKPGQAYAVGYLAQLMLATRASRLREVKLDPKWFREMVDLLAAFEYAEKKQKEQKRKAREERERKKARAKQKNRKPQTHPSAALPPASLGRGRAGTDGRGHEGTDEGEAEGKEEELGYNAHDEAAGH